MATWVDVAYTHYAMRSDGAKFVNGQRDDSADTSWVDLSNGVLTLQAGVYDELLILPYAASEEEIRSWYEQAAPFYDPAQQLQALDNQIWMDSTGLNMQNVASPNKMMNLNAHRLAFWDANGVPVGVIGDLDEVAAQIDPTMPNPGYGFLLAQGAVWATQAVVRDSLTDFGTTGAKIADETIPLAKLFPNIVVSMPGSGHVTIYGTNERKWLSATNQLLYAYQFTRQQSDGSLIDTLTMRTRGHVLAWGASRNEAYMFLEFRLNSIVVGTYVFGRFNTGGNIALDTADITVDLDLTPYDSNETLTFELYGRLHDSPGDENGYIYGMALYKQDDVSLSAKTPSAARSYSQCDYVCQVSCEISCQNVCQSSCQSSCQLSCQSSCQTGCESSCQRSCQDSCETSCQKSCERSCQSTCEKMSQSCFVDGTPVTVYDPETGEVSEIPIEDLEPGMFMPYYDPQTDRVMISECISNEPSITATLYEIEVEGPTVTEPITLRVTPEQPFDVWRKNRMTGEWGWSVMQAQYLKPGDKMIRPFDEQNRMPNVISVVKLPPQPPTRVWDPKTVARRYIVAGFADALVK